MLYPAELRAQRAGLTYANGLRAFLPWLIGRMKKGGRPAC